MPGEPDQVDEVAVRASDPFGSSPTVTLHLPGEAGAAEGMALSLADLEAPSGSHSEPAGAGAPLQADGLEWRSLVPLETEIGRAPVCTPVTNAHLVCRLLLEKKKNKIHKNTNKT